MSSVRTSSKYLLKVIRNFIYINIKNREIYKLLRKNYKIQNEYGI